MYHRRGSGGGAPSRRWLWGSGGKTPSRWVIFVSFWKKKLFLSCWITFHTCLQPFERTRFLTLKANRKNLVVQSLFYLQLNFKTRLKSCIMV